MKKSILIYAALITTTFANAQIVKKWSGDLAGFGSGLQILQPTTSQWDAVIGNYFVTWSTNIEEYLDIMDPSSMTVVKSFETDNWFGLNEKSEEGPYFISKGIFTTDDKWAALIGVATDVKEYVCEECGPVWSGSTITEKTFTEIQVRDEDGAILAKIPFYLKVSDMYSNFSEKLSERVKLVKSGNLLKLVVMHTTEEYEWTSVHDVYSLPGDGSYLDLISAPSNNHIHARKYLLNDQVRIDSNERTYSIQGQQVK